MFDWNHSYGPLDWPREGTTLLNVESDRPLYWKAETLETFDGLRWVRTDQNQSTSPLGEIPDEADPKWLERVRVTVRSLRTDFVIVAGTPVEVDGAGGSLSPSSDGTIRSLGEPLERGDSYTVNSYSPNPKPRELRAADGPYDLELARYTRIGLPGARDAVTEPPGAQDELLGRSPATSVEVPLRGEPGSGTSPGRAPRWPTGPTLAPSDSAQRLTDGRTHHLRRRAQRRAAPAGGLHLQRAAAHPSVSAGGLPVRGQGGLLPAVLRRDGADAAHVGDPGAGGVGLLAGLLQPRHGRVPRARSRRPLLGRGLLSHDRLGHLRPHAHHLAGRDRRPGRRGTRPQRLGLLAARRRRPRSAGSQPRARRRRRAARRARRSAPARWRSSCSCCCSAAPRALVALRVRRSRRLTPLERSEARLRELERALPRLGWRLAPGSTLLELERRLRSSAGPTAAGYVAGLREGRFSPAPPAPPDRPAAARAAARAHGRGRPAQPPARLPRAAARRAAAARLSVLSLPFSPARLSLLP